MIRCSTMVPKASRATGYGVFECAFGVFWFLGSWLLGVQEAMKKLRVRSFCYLLQIIDYKIMTTSPTGVRGMMMLTKNTAQSLGITDRTDAEQSISGGVRYLQDMMSKVPESVPENERIWFHCL